MAHTEVLTPTIFRSPSPFSQAVVVPAGATIHVAGQVAQDETGTNLGIGDPVVQIDRALANVRALVEAGGASMADVFRINIYVLDRAFLPAIAEARRRYFTEPYPATTVLVVAGLAHPDWLVEVDAVASVASAAQND